MLFEPFTQAGQDFARSKSGLGLGLALTKALVELHRGEVAALSPGPGKGRPSSSACRERTRRSCEEPSRDAVFAASAAVPCSYPSDNRRVRATVEPSRNVEHVLSLHTLAYSYRHEWRLV